MSHEVNEKELREFIGIALFGPKYYDYILSPLTEPRGKYPSERATGQLNQVMERIKSYSETYAAEKDFPVVTYYRERPYLVTKEESGAMWEDAGVPRGLTFVATSDKALAQLTNNKTPDKEK